MKKTIWSNIKKIPGIKNVSTIALASVFGNLLSAFFWLYLADLLGTEEYGKLGYFIGIAGIISSITLFGGQHAMTVYTAKGVKIQSSFYFFSLVSSIVTGIILFFIFSNFGLSIFVLGYVIFTLFTNELLGKKLYKNWSYHFIIQKILMIIFSLGFFYAVGPIGVLFGMGLSFLPFSRRLYDVFKEQNIDFKILKDRLGFIINQNILNFLGSFRTQIDKLLIVPMFGYAILGNYFLGIQVIGLLVILPGAFFKFLLPEDSSGTSTKQIKIVLLLIAFGITLFGIFLANPLIEFFFPQFHDSLQLVPILSLAVIPAAVKDILTSQILAKENSKFLLIANLIAIASFVSGILILGEIFGIVGVAFSFIISQTTYAAVLIIGNYKFLK
jgi:O-antigen/teichoic acid export membrane protein